MSQWTTQSRTSTVEERQAQREERTFRQGQDAARALVRALSVPDRTVQLAIAKVLIDAGKRTGSVIAQEGSATYERERWTKADPEGRELPNLRQWHSGPTATDAEPADDLPITIPA